MGKGFDMKFAFKQAKQSKPQIVADDDGDGELASKRNAFHEFFRFSVQKLPKTVKRSGKRKTQMIHLELPARPMSQYHGQRPLSMRPNSQIIMPPRSTKEPAILTTWGAKSPSMRSTSQYSPAMHDSVTGRHQPARSPLSATSFPRSEPRALGQDDMDKMFAGAPQLEVVDSAIGPLPKFTIHGKGPSDWKAANDFDEPAHFTFSTASLAGHGLSEETNPGEYGLLEVPDMRSISGRDPGTVGLAHFLQLPISDSKLAEEEHETLSRRVKLLIAPEELGLQPLDLAGLVDRLTELGEDHQSQRDSTLNEQKAAEMYADLFSRLLVTPKLGTVASEEDPMGLEVQIAALVQILGASQIWYNFSYVEWRIRLGQLLWSEPDDATDQEEEEVQSVSERDALLLQITLASELLVRLNLSDKPLLSRALSQKINWDLVVAQRFLDNVRITRKPIEEKQENRNSVFSAMTFFTAKESPEDAFVQPILSPRHEKRQLDGLMKFAETLSWPHMQDIDLRFQNRLQSHSLLSPGLAPALSPKLDVYATPVASPTLSSNSQSGHFARPLLGRRTTTAQSVQLLPASAYGIDSLDAGGWMSRSWLTGMVLPGEAASHFLIATLLENSPQAIETLGESANMYGGFLYSGRSYWSKSTVVGRVLAAQQRASDCMGWISSPSVPANQADEWINVETKDLPTTTPRISGNGVVAQQSAFVRSKDSNLLEEDDFTWPIDSPPVMGNEARYEGLTLIATDTRPALSPEHTAREDSLDPLPRSTACLTFASKSSKHMKITVPLTHDVYFVSSLPCFPTSRSRPSSRSNNNTSLHPPSPLHEKDLPDAPCHPLHASYALEVVPAATLLSFSSDTYQSGGGSGSGSDGADQVLVLDCRGSCELELLARAWCAKVGEHALVAAVDRTCLACCVREASGLGIKIVIRR